MKHLSTIQNEFLKIAAQKKKTDRNKSKDNKTWAEFFKSVGEMPISNPDPSAKKTRIKIKSLRGQPVDSPKNKLLNSLYKKWKGSGQKGVKEHTKTVDSKHPSKSQEKNPLRKKLKEKEKILKQKTSPKKTEVTQDDDSTLSPSAKYKKYLDEQKKLKGKLEEKKKKITEQKVQNESTEQMKENEPKIQTDVQPESKSESKIEPIKLSEQGSYENKLAKINENVKNVRNDISFLSDPPRPSANAEKEVQDSADAINRALSGVGLKGANISEVKNAPNTLNYTIKFDNDQNRIKGSNWLLSKAGKDTISSFVGKEQDVIVSEDRQSGTLNVQVPKTNRDVVSLKELLTDDTYLSEAKKPGRLMVPIGLDTKGEAQTFDFNGDAPHMMIAGGTKSGKSVFFNSLINSLMASYSPEQVKFTFIDVAKSGAEFGQYDKSKYTNGSVATTEPAATKVLLTALKEAETRNKKLKDLSGRIGLDFKDIQSYNKFIGKKPDEMNEAEKAAYSKLSDDEKKIIPENMIFVDEAKDLFSGDNSKAVKNAIDRILTIGRSAGLHIALATQSPKMGSIPGKIQSNIGAKLSLRLNTESDAEAIGIPEAHDLLMFGDGIFETPTSKTRLQTPYVSGNESKKFIENNPKSQVQPEITPKIEPQKTDSIQNTEPKKEKVEQIVTPQQSEQTETSDFENRIDDLKKKLQIQKDKIQKALAEAQNRTKKLQEKQLETKKQEQEQQNKLEQQQQSQNKRKNIEEKDEQFVEEKEPEPTIGQQEIFTSPKDTNIDVESQPTIEKSDLSSHDDDPLSDEEAVQRAIDEVSKPMSRDEILNSKKEPAKSFEKIPEPEQSKETNAAKDIDQQKKSLLDKFKKLFKNK